MMVRVSSHQLATPPQIPSHLKHQFLAKGMEKALPFPPRPVARETTSRFKHKPEKEISTPSFPHSAPK